MKTSKAIGLDYAIRAEALQNGRDAMFDIARGFCAEVYTSLMPRTQSTTSVILLLPYKEDLSQMTNQSFQILRCLTTKP